MNTTRGSLGRVLGSAVTGLALTVSSSGCGGHAAADPAAPVTVAAAEAIDAGAAGIQAAATPEVLAASVAADAADEPGTATGRPDAAMAGLPAEVRRDSAGKSTTDGSTRVTEPRSAPARSSGTQPGRAHVAAPAARAAALPAGGSYGYDITGTSTLGPVPERMTLTVAPAADGAQRWTFDLRHPDGTGTVEDFTMLRRSDGLYMSEYRLQLSSGLVQQMLEFAPPHPVLLAPDDPDPGERWRFELTSTDGCSVATTTGQMLSRRSAPTRHLRLTTTLRGTGLVTCPPFEAERTQDIWYPRDSLMPTRIDSAFTGTLAGMPATASTTATLRRSAD